jgi:hypothetical protein
MSPYFSTPFSTGWEAFATARSSSNAALFHAPIPLSSPPVQLLGRCSGQGYSCAQNMQSYTCTTQQ